VELDNLRTIVAGTYEMWTPRACRLTPSS